MPKIFSEENREDIKLELLDKGFERLKNAGLRSVNIDELTDEACIAKGTFYNLFKSKSEFMYHMMIHERNRAKVKLISYLDTNGKLTRESLREYLLWLSEEDPNVFSYLTEAEKKRLVSSWKEQYIEDPDNDRKTMQMLISLLESPAADPNWKLACNYMKLVAVSLAERKVFIPEEYNDMIRSLVDKITDLLCE